jgi:dienelactone hydrolase
MPVSRRRKVLSFGSAILLAGIAALAIVWWRGVPFPETRGPFRVGRTSFHLVDSSRKESFTDAPDDIRELMVTVHYPAQLGDGERASAYADAKLTAAVAEAYHAPAFLISLIHSHAVEKAPCANQPEGFPVVLFSPGFGTHPLFYTAMLEELASQGFVVVSLCHPYSTGVTVFPDGRVVRANDAGSRFEVMKKRHEGSFERVEKERNAVGEVWLADVRFVLDSLNGLNKHDDLLAGRMDLSRVGIFGHSFGGATAAAAVQTDRRFKAGINLDGSDLGETRGESIRDRFVWLCSEPPDFAKLPPPAFRTAREAEKLDGADRSQDPRPVAITKGKTPSGARVLMKRIGDPAAAPLDPSHHLRPNGGLRAPPGSRITLAGSRHPIFESDAALLSATFPFSWLVRDQDLGTLNGRRAVQVVSSFVTDFFRQRLRNEEVPWLDNPTSKFAELSRDTDLAPKLEWAR